MSGREARSFDKNPYTIGTAEEIEYARSVAGADAGFIDNLLKDPIHQLQGTDQFEAGDFGRGLYRNVTSDLSRFKDIINKRKMSQQAHSEYVKASQERPGRDATILYDRAQQTLLGI